MRILSKRSLRCFWETIGYEDAQAPLEAWHDAVLKANWKTPQEVKDQFGGASVIANNRVVFNIGGNKYRLIVEIQYRVGIVWVKFIGTHAQYDRIDAGEVNEY